MKALVVGVGFMGELHARTIQSSRLADLAGVVDRDMTTAASVGKQLRSPAFSDLRHAIREVEPDVAIIATPDAHHREPAEILIGAGIDVLVEKPLATTVEDAEVILAVAKRVGTRLMVGHTTRFLSRYVQVMNAISAGQLGRLIMITTSTWGPRSIGARVSSETNPLWHFGIHDIELIQWLSDSVISEIDGAQLVESSSGLSTFAATGALSSGASFNLVTGWTLPDTASARWDLKLHCANGVLQAEWCDDGVTEYSIEGVRHLDCTLWPPIYGQIHGALRLEIDHFLEAVATGGEFVVSSNDAMNAVRSAATLEKACTVRRVL